MLCSTSGLESYRPVSNNGMQRTALRATAEPERVCRAWHESSRVKVPVPGM